MNLCIYSKKSEPEVSFKKQEHIFPASLGGLSKLPKGYVSDEINEKFSKDLELDFTREGFLAIVRQFIGPGSRGNINNPKKATQSKVHLISDEDDNNALGYIVEGVPTYIKQIIFNLEDGALSNSTKLIFPKTKNVTEELEKFLNADYKHITLIRDIHIPENEIILGLNEYQEKGKGALKKKWFIGHNPNVSINEDLKEKLKKFTKEVYLYSVGKKFDLTIEYKKVTSHQPIIFSQELFFRTCAKIAFNYVASIVGQEAVLNKEFDVIRNYVLNGGDGDFLGFIDSEKVDGTILSPKSLGDKHAIVASFKEKDVLVNLIFYGNIYFVVKMTHEMDVYALLSMGSPVNGIIVDWRNRKEINIAEYCKYNKL
ncbi:TPA: hypothetical protein KOS16_003770 [Clostridioides difficile]|nr:hypothetical protein [Clostridioides difficile]